MNKTAIKQIDALSKKIGLVDAELSALKAEYDALRLKALQSVAFTRVGDTITLDAGDRILKAKKNAYGRYTVKEAGKIIVKEYMGGNIHDLRFEVAMGKI